MATADQIALRILIDGGPRMPSKLTALRVQIERQLHGGACPNCGHPGPHDDNGATGSDRMFCCAQCGEHWDAIQEVVR